MNIKTVRIYDTDSHASQFTATVLSCTPYEGKMATAESPRPLYDIVLDCTAFFPGGGGQDADRGTLASAPLLSIYETEEVVHHIIDRPLPVGTKVRGEVNFMFRFSNMQQHSGEHVLCALLHNAYGVDNVGFHMGHREVTLDVNGSFTLDDLEDIEKKANQIVTENRRITISYPDETELSSLDYRSKKDLTGAVRIVTIEGLDRCACCAPHVMVTGEIGLIKILAAERYKGGTRISILCGQRALAMMNVFQEQLRQIDIRLSSVPEQTSDAVRKLETSETELRERLVRMQRRLIHLLAESAPQGSDPYVVFDVFEDASNAREYVNLLAKRRDGLVALFYQKTESPEDRTAYQYILSIGAAGGEHSVIPAGKALNERFSGRGGGSPSMIQGTVHGTREELTNFFHIQ